MSLVWNAALCIVTGEGASVLPGKYRSMATSAIAGTGRSTPSLNTRGVRGIVIVDRPLKVSGRTEEA